MKPASILSMTAAFGVLLAACGGGGGEEATALSAERAGAAPLEATAGERAAASAGRMRALAVVPGVDPLAAAVQLFDFGEAQFPQFFPTKQTNRVLPGLVYRYYPETGAYLAVIDWRVYVLGGPFGPLVIDVGAVTDYITVTPPAGTLTAKQLSSCPDVSGSSSPSFYTCMIGSLTGHQVLRKRECTFSISAQGVLAMQSEEEHFSLAPADFKFVHFTKSVNDFMNISVSAVYERVPSVDFDISTDSVLSPKTFFGDGGTMTIEVNQRNPTANLVCRFTVPKE